MTVRSFTTHKVGNKPEENEDSFSYDEERGLFAIADGATEYPFSGEWSRSLTSMFLGTGCLENSADFQEFVRKTRDVWRNKIDISGIPWFVRNKLSGGAYSTFLGLCIDYEAGEFKVIFVGDSCLFHLTDSGYEVFPPLTPSDFRNNPKLVWSGYGLPELRRVSAVRSSPSIMKRNWREGDSFILATDAFSKWIIEGPTEEKLTEIMENFEALCSRIDEMRINHTIKNDDVTILVVTP
ncbi:MAG: hypothetical protein M1454_02790 [Candidatus Thermoplasmatota archaeon]|nr:hypothetical protein [Candidatus Thermoplasmatota archaeon]MCL5731522.1 hypothetical protein [Candidatus Thermoplasmatota archaeon]